MRYLFGIVLIVGGLLAWSWMAVRNSTLVIGEDPTKRQIANGFRPDGSHDFDPDLEPGVRVCEVDRLERLLKESM